ncbi:LolA family protein [Texcoconibacillus texcoconensis]|uniref:Outer membrane lipoprotein-sorting protein n=1 Tax=Texcoconibacillus texcoconensis TaxID=1095777 RepID=A0A840QSK3_9BACI|nr:DUF2092 domain-containing protein [Texcoconibacillus texcoconensis]MBB5174299.1 outer membrane lipoprotein-sorting protein [Texcoconibacillus texcoconensis]
MKRKVVMSLIPAAFVAMSACNEGEPSKEDILANALSESDELDAFYMETDMQISMEGEETEKMNAKEWHFPEDSGISKDRKELTRNEGTTTYIVSDGDMSLSYEEGDTEAVQNEVIQAEMESELNQRLQMVEDYQDTHDIELVGEEEVNGRDTYHVLMETSDEEAANEDVEVWIDQENWLLMKQISHMGDLRLTFEIIDLDTDPEYDEELFTLDLPEDVEIVDNQVNEIEVEESVEELSVDEVEDRFGQPVLLLDEEAGGVELENIEYIERSYDNFDEEELTFTYVKNQEPFMEMRIDEPTEEQQPVESERDIDIPGRAEHTIRGEDGHSTDMDTLRYIIWTEEGLRYNLSTQQPEVSVDDLLEAAERMESSS